MQNYQNQLDNKAELRAEINEYVEVEVEKLTKHVALIDALNAIAVKINAFNARYVKPVQERIEQQKNAIKSSDTMQSLHKAHMAGTSNEIEEVLFSSYNNKALVDSLLDISKKDCTPEQWKTITIIKQHYNNHVAKKIDDILVMD